MVVPTRRPPASNFWTSAQVRSHRHLFSGLAPGGRDQLDLLPIGLAGQVSSLAPRGMDTIGGPKQPAPHRLAEQGFTLSSIGFVNSVADRVLVVANPCAGARENP